MGWLKTILLIALTLSAASFADAAEIVAMRAYEHKGFHRLTIIISQDISLDAVKEDEMVVLKMRDITTKTINELPHTGVISVKGLKHLSDDTGEYSALEVSMPRGSKVVQTVKAGPFRVILDVYPPADYMHKKALDPYMQAVLLEQDANRVMAFNDSWRWVYRKKVVDTMRADLYDTAQAEAFKAALGVDATDRDGVSVEASKAVLRSKAEGNTPEAALLSDIMSFYSGAWQPVTLENSLRGAADSAVKGLGYLLIGEHFEKKGFFPEASGYYTLAAGAVKSGPVKALADFRKARLLFFEHKYAEAKEGFTRAAGAGYASARWWFANASIIRGETDLAWEIIGKGSLKDAEIDPITRLGLADMHLLKGNHKEARFMFASLRSRYQSSGLVDTYLAMREADALFFEGSRDDAIALYARSKEKLKGEPWALMSLALADACFVTGTRESLEKAEKLFEGVAGGSYDGSTITSMRLIATRVALGRFEAAYEDVKRFHATYPTSPLRQDINRLSQTLFYGWVSSLVDGGDHLRAVKVYSETPLSMPFGKKGEISLKIARSYRALGLAREAASNLDTVIKIGTEAMAEEAMLMLADIYLDQRDSGSAARLMRAFSTRFPRARRSADIERLRARMSYVNREYEKSALVSAGDDTGLIDMKGDSLARTGDLKEASKAFEGAARQHEAKGNTQEAKSAWLRSADAKFDSGDIRGALEAYRNGLDNSGKSDMEDRSWALYRLARCYSRLNMKDKEAEALKELKALGGQYGQWSAEIFEEAKSLQGRGR